MKSYKKDKDGEPLIEWLGFEDISLVNKSMVFELRLEAKLLRTTPNYHKYSTPPSFKRLDFVD